MNAEEPIVPWRRIYDAFADRPFRPAPRSTGLQRWSCAGKPQSDPLPRPNRQELAGRVPEIPARATPPFQLTRARRRRAGSPGPIHLPHSNRPELADPVPEIPDRSRDQQSVSALAGWI